VDVSETLSNNSFLLVPAEQLIFRGHELKKYSMCELGGCKYKQATGKAAKSYLILGSNTAFEK
jgi:hypothetical protein